MKSILLVVLFVLGSGLCASAQFYSTPEDSKPPEEYAAYIADLYAKHLSLSPDQKQQTYETVFAKRTILDSIKANYCHVEGDKMWAISTMLDTKYKAILSASQYMAYQDLRNIAIVRMKMDSTAHH